ncbi:hypothetical protein R3P38DRAFT_2950347 [Favolaschia claudopus]|uniref:C3H1-type domain-containing protein n=1 Tax=Favolaschia claudopus TaxID=2862362 RepID=A0AAW0BHP4_9AGAR
MSFKNGRRHQRQRSHRTKRCKYFDAGYCQTGDACTFIHVDTAGNIPADKMEMVHDDWIPLQKPFSAKKTDARKGRQHFPKWRVISGGVALGWHKNGVHPETSARLPAPAHRQRSLSLPCTLLTGRVKCVHFFCRIPWLLKNVLLHI